MPLRLGVLLLIGLLAGACSGDRPPNVVLITLDTTRRDHLSAYGYERATSPRLAAFARQGIRLDNAYTPTPTTAPSHASIFTSLYPTSHGVLKNGIRFDAPGLHLAERFSEAGYETAAFVSSFVLRSKFGWGRGFGTYDDRFQRAESSGGGNSFLWEGERIYEVFDRRADHTARRAIEWVEELRDPERPFFLFVHFFDPHDPYAPPGRFARRFVGSGKSGLDLAVGRYDAEIAFTDLEIGEFLDALQRAGLAPETLVVITADHGEGLRDHGHMWHGAQLYEEAMRVPMLLRWPGVLPAGRILDSAVSLVDLAPTLLELVGLSIDAEPLDGRSFAPLLRMGEVEGAPRDIFFYRRPYSGKAEIGGSWPNGEAFGVRSGGWKYIEGADEGTRELYDLSADPEERHNLAVEQPHQARRMAGLLQEWRDAQVHVTPAASRVSPQDRARLRELGYTD